MAPISRRRRFGPVLGFLLFCCTAVLCAEFISDSTPAPLLVGDKLLAYLPYYVGLVWLIGIRGGLSARSLYLFGATLGLAGQTFGTGRWPALGLGWEQTVIALTYRPLLAVVVPVLVCASVFGTPYRVGLSRRARWALLAALPVMAGAFAAVGGQQLVVFVAAIVVNAVLYTIVVTVYRRWGGPVPWLPTWLAIVAAAGAAAELARGLWLAYGASPLPILATLGGLALMIAALYRSTRRDRPVEDPGPPNLSVREYLAYLPVFAALAIGFFWLIGAVNGVTANAGSETVALIALATGVAGVAYLAVVVVWMLLPRRMPRSAAGPHRAE